jgi:hypothetical protein
VRFTQDPSSRTPIVEGTQSSEGNLVAAGRRWRSWRTTGRLPGRRAHHLRAPVRPRDGEPACRRDSVSSRGTRWPSICAAHLGTAPKSGRATRVPRLALLRVGFTEPAGSPRSLVRSYRTVSPLPVRGRPPPSAVCSLWHCPAGHPDWPLASTLPCGVPTFLDTVLSESVPRPPGRLTVASSVSRDGVRLFAGRWPGPRQPVGRVGGCEPSHGRFRRGTPRAP